MSNSCTRRKSVILNSILLTAASVPCLSSPASRRNSAATEDSLEELIRATQRQGRRASEFAKTSQTPPPDIRNKNIYSHEEAEQNQGTEKSSYSPGGWSTALLEDDEDFSARAMSLTMTGLLSRLRQLLGAARDVVDDRGMGVQGLQGGQQLLDIVKQLVGGKEMPLDTTQQLADWVNKGFPEDQNVDKRNDGNRGFSQDQNVDKRNAGKLQGWHRQQSLGWKEEEADDIEIQTPDHDVQQIEEDQDWENANMSGPEEETEITLHEDGAWDDDYTDQEDNIENQGEIMDTIEIKEKKNVAAEGEREVENYNSIPFNPNHLGPRPVVKKSTGAGLDISTLIKALARKPTTDGDFLKCLMDIQKYSECRQKNQKNSQTHEEPTDVKTGTGQNKHYNFVRFGK